jgi:hypothetical protein
LADKAGRLLAGVRETKPRQDRKDTGSSRRMDTIR